MTNLLSFMPCVLDVWWVRWYFTCVARCCANGMYRYHNLILKWFCRLHMKTRKMSLKCSLSTFHTAEEKRGDKSEGDLFFVFPHKFTTYHIDYEYLDFSILFVFKESCKAYSWKEIHLVVFRVISCTCTYKKGSFKDMHDWWFQKMIC